MEIARKEYKKNNKSEDKKGKKVEPDWIYKTISSEESSPIVDEEFNKFIEEFRK